MTDKRVAAKKAIDNCRILQTLSDYTPEVVSTIFADLDVAGSDIDIVCCHKDVTEFTSVFHSAFSSERNYEFENRKEYVVGKFSYDDFIVEVYSTTRPVHTQVAYRHFQIMKRLSRHGGVKFSSRVRELKLSGLKTEPAICQVLSLLGNPYTAILELESWSENELANYVRKCV